MEDYLRDQLELVKTDTSTKRTEKIVNRFTNIREVGKREKMVHMFWAHLPHNEKGRG